MLGGNLVQTPDQTFPSEKQSKLQVTKSSLMKSGFQMTGGAAHVATLSRCSRVLRVCCVVSCRDLLWNFIPRCVSTSVYYCDNITKNGVSLSADTTWDPGYWGRSVPYSQNPVHLEFLLGLQWRQFMKKKVFELLTLAAASPARRHHGRRVMVNCSSSVPVRSHSEIDTFTCHDGDTPDMQQLT